MRHSLKEPSLAVDPINPAPGANSQCSPSFPQRCCLLHVNRAQAVPCESCYAKRQEVPFCKLLWAAEAPQAHQRRLLGCQSQVNSDLCHGFCPSGTYSSSFSKPCFNFTPPTPLLLLQASERGKFLLNASPPSAAQMHQDSSGHIRGDETPTK